jgi:hypothetical protein
VFIVHVRQKSHAENKTSSSERRQLRKLRERIDTLSPTIPAQPGPAEGVPIVQKGSLRRRGKIQKYDPPTTVMIFSSTSEFCLGTILDAPRLRRHIFDLREDEKIAVPKSTTRIYSIRGGKRKFGAHPIRISFWFSLNCQIHVRSAEPIARRKSQPTRIGNEDAV